MKQKSWIAVSVGVLLLGGLVMVPVTVARQTRTAMAYYNPDVNASLEAIKRNPDDAAAHMSLAHYYIGRGVRYHAETAHELQEVLRVEPENREAKGLLVYKLAKLNRKAEALKLCHELAQQQDGWGKAAQKYIDKHK